VDVDRVLIKKMEAKLESKKTVNVEEDIGSKVKKPFKVLAVSDTHGDNKKIQELADLAEKEKVDLVVLAGDFSKDHEEIPENVIGPFLKENRRVVFVPGNHDTISTTYFISEMYKIKHLHGKATMYGDIGFFGCGFANIGPNAITEEEILYQLKLGFEEIKDAKTKVMITHSHPAGTNMEKLTQIMPGSVAVRKAIEEIKPDLVICGHVHEGEGIEEMIGNSRVLNVAKSGKIIEFG
jgi:uncharacterized protein